ncbi:MAG TPA: tetratricopeptide repeat protein [Ferruginibacter sp.]|nr:tetratricopeptide repeat protein [Ferruginibacter sp.]HMP19413.1 tetratricopeptide repeat protein [Ferruginibacter sp.]
MKKTPTILLSGGLVVLLLLLFFGKTVPPGNPDAAHTNHDGHDHDEHAAFDVQNALTQAKAGLTLSQAAYITAIENSISRGNVQEQQVKAYNQLANFWKDSAANTDLYVFYTAEAAKLVNSEKNLTFAARQIAAAFRTEADVDKRAWKAGQAIELYEKAIVLNPANDSLKVEMAGCYVFGKGMAGDAAETMKGVQQLLEVVKTNPENMQAQLLLGIGAVISTQYDKAIERLQRVVQKQPGNLEAISWLADAYAAKGDRENAIKWYNTSKQLVNNPAFSEAVDERIKQLK